MIKYGDKGPAIAISIHVDDSDEKYKIKGKVEIVYANHKSNLSPKNWANKKTSLLPTDLAGFPPSKKRDNYSYLAQDEAGHLVKRNPEKERDIIDYVKIPFSHQKSTGEFAFTTRFLKKFAVEYLPKLKEKNVLFRFDDNLSPIINNTYRATFNIESSSEIDWFEGKIEIEGIQTSSDAKALLNAHYNKEEVVQTSRGEWVVVDQLNIENIAQALENLGIRLSKSGKSSLFNKGHLVALGSIDELTIRAEKKVEELRKHFANSYKNSKFTPPKLSPSLEKILRPYQKEGTAFLHHLFQLKVGGVLADDMGLGKTLQAITFIESVIQNTNKDSLFLVICPLAALSVWEMECKRFAHHIPIQIWHGLKRRSGDMIKSGIIISTYMTVAQDIIEIENTEFTAIFADEAQNIKNIYTKASKIMRLLKSNSIFCLTGTPVENYLSDLWSLLDVCFPGLLGTRKAFKKAYGSSQVLSNKDNLLTKIAPFILRRRKQEVLKELPQKTETIISLPLHDSQAVIYENIRREAVEVLKDAGNSYIVEMLPYLMKLRRVCCHPDLKNEIKSSLLDSSKLTYLKEKIPEIQESSSGVLIFSQFTDVLKKVAELLNENDIEYFYLDGSTSTPARKKIVEQFQDGKKAFFLISLKAGGTALTLHKADTVIHLDPWWNPAAEDQATDRAHRIGQKRNVFVYKLIAKGTIEEKVLLLQQKKKELFDALFNHSTNTGKTISKKELMDLLDIVDQEIS